MAKDNRFKKKALEEEARSIVSSKPIPPPSTDNVKMSNNTETTKDEITVLEETPSPTNNAELSSKKIIIEKEEKIKMSKLGTSIRLDLKKDLDKEAKKYKRTTNNIVNVLLDNLYDVKTNKFNIDISKKESFKTTSYHMKEEHFKAIEKLSKSTGYNKSEVFNMLIEEGLINLK